ncbi:hydroxymethylglutaryl-CoA lyase [Ornithinimicrobium sp. F0845]|uniref:hydroxymethylglutaryl-CoA lyase n=1 Tax=Ornithinimicrobium sp. F0845 TaxID=2926412 RepID=UPI001FF598A4|nr:hydroxymethylglutaryl-CoA lyase [Ornithinimicrobium sp. F0845]MCK0113454.1 hydroxymethylglutaryl-CoA lyase [Ornithinimicrobium sp. F0845]
MSTLAGLPDAIRLVEVGLRDGLQAVPEPMPTTEKVAVVEGLIAAGVREIEAVSFAHPRVLPQLADAEAVMAAVPRLDDVTYRGLVPNLRGAQRAVPCGLDEWTLVIAADEETSLRNQRRTVTEMLEELGAVAALAREHGVRLVVAVACAFFAPARGPVPREEYLRAVDAAVDAGVPALYLACTTGQEHPGEVGDRIAEVRARHTALEVGVHLHNRNGFAPANAIAAMQAGAAWLEGSFCGLGGDLWFPGDPTVLGNAPLEDLIHLCDSLGVATGISLEKYLPVARRVEELTGVPSTSFVARGGSRSDLAAAEWPDSPQGSA